MPGPITFEDARAIVASIVGATWQGPGVFEVAEWGQGDDDDWNVVAGPADGEVPLDDVVYLVSRQDGAFRRENYLDVVDKLDAMRPVGAPPDD